jgi:hypothetical protein
MEALSQYKVNSITDVTSVAGLTERVDLYRVDACRNLDSEQRSKMGQFFTLPSVARFMASLFGNSLQEIREVDYEQVVRPDDPDLIIHIATSEIDQFVLDRMGVFKHSEEH